jgi:hypothetical protein
VRFPSFLATFSSIVAEQMRPFFQWRYSSSIVSVLNQVARLVAMDLLHVKRGEFALGIGRRRKTEGDWEDGCSFRCLRYFPLRH